jgi:hypothetical protein
MRKLELEPGFLCHTGAEADALYVIKTATSMQLQTRLINTSMPALLLNNLPPQISVENLKATFEKYSPKRIHIHGTTTLEV